MRGCVFAVCLPLLLGSASSFSILQLNGQWQLRQEGGNLTGLKASVPGGIYSDLMDNKVIGDVFWGYNDTSSRWVSMANWTYSRQFAVESRLLRNKKINLIFEGLDTFASIRLNGIEVGMSRNMFLRYIFDVKDQLKVGANVVAVTFFSPVRMAAEVNGRLNYSVPPNSVPLDYHGEAHVNKIRKMQASFAWDWGPPLPSMGIWKSVYLEVASAAVIRHVVVNIEGGGDSYLVKIRTEFDVVPKGKLIHTLQLDNKAINHITDVDQSITETHFIVSKLEVRNWWPNGYGEQYLYNLSVQLVAPSGESNEKKMRLGFRIVELVQDDLDTGADFYFRINGLPVFAKGANEIPLDILPERGTAHAAARRILKAAKDVHMNMIRVWGGGVYETDYFYDLADELGIMIWQDFMFACALYPTTADFLDNVAEEVRFQVKRLHNHPSVVLWAGNNENEAALMQNWFNISNYPLYKRDYVTLYIDTIRANIEQISNKAFLSSSPTNGKQSEKQGYLAPDPGSPLFGDVHFYNYLADSWSVGALPVPRFASEYGYQSLPEVRSWLAVAAPADLRWDSRLMMHRQHHPGGTVENVLLIGYQLDLVNVSAVVHFDQYVYYSQIVQAMSVKIETEFYRSFMGRLNNDGAGRTMGALFWQLNDVWVAPTWSGIDHLGKWKMMHYFAKDFFAPIIVTGYINNWREMEVYAICDNPHMQNIGLDVNVFIDVFNWGDFKALRRVEKNVTILYGKSVNVLHLPIDDYLVSLKNCGGLSTAKNNCFFRLSMEQAGLKLAPDNYVFPSKLKHSALLTPIVTITNIKQIDNDGKKFEISLKSTKIALFVWLDANPVVGVFSENGFMIVSSDEKLIYFDSEKGIHVEQLRKLLNIKNLRDLRFVNE